MSNPLAVLRYRGYAAYAAARFCTTLCWQMLSVAVGWQVYALTRNPLDLGYLGLVQFLPFIFLVLPGGYVADHTDRRGADAVFDAAGVAPAVETALGCVGHRRPMVSVAIYERPLTTPLLNLVMNESRIQGSLCYTADDFEAVIALMARDAYNSSGWVTSIALDDVIEEGFEALHGGTKMKVLVDPAAA